MALKIARLGLEVVVDPSATPLPTTTSSLVLPAKLPSVEETLRKEAAALDKACEPGLSKVEVSRLQVISSLAKNYRDGVADYLNYRGLELRLVEMEKKYEKMIDEYGKVLQEKADRKKGKDDASGSVSAS